MPHLWPVDQPKLHLLLIFPKDLRLFALCAGDTANGPGKREIGFNTRGAKTMSNIKLKSHAHCRLSRVLKVAAVLACALTAALFVQLMPNEAGCEEFLCRRLKPLPCSRSPPRRWFRAFCPIRLT